MKTLTEFSTLVLKNAAAARSAARAKLGSAAPAPAAPVAAADADGATAAEGGDAPAPAEGGDAPAPAEGDAPAAEGEAAAAPAAVANPMIGEVATTLGVPEDRAARLLEALEIIGDRMDQVRLVRVFQGETGPHGAVSRGEFHYAIDKVAGAGGGRRDDRGGGRGDRGGRGGGDRGRGGPGGGGGGGGGGGFGGPGGGDRKPRGLGSLVNTNKTDDKPKEDDRPGRGEMPRAGIGWQLTAAPRDMSKGGGGGPGGPRPRRDRDDRRGPRPGGGGGDRPRGPRPPRLGPDGQPLPFDQNFRGGGGGGGDRGPRGPRPDRGPRPEVQNAQQGPRLGPDGQPLPPRVKRDRKPIGPDENGMGPDGKPWDPERRAQRMAERGAPGAGSVNPAGGSGVEATTESTPPAPTSEQT